MHKEKNLKVFKLNHMILQSKQGETEKLTVGVFFHASIQMSNTNW